MVDMEKYIRQYKHLIGCEFRVKSGWQKGKYVAAVGTSDDGYFTHIVCNAGYAYVFRYLSDFGFYLGYEVDYPSSYEDYMIAHYPEYEHVWGYQLCK